MTPVPVWLPGVTESQEREAEQLTLSRMMGVFYLFFGGSAVAVFVLLLEFVLACYTDVVTDRVHKVRAPIHDTARAARLADFVHTNLAVIRMYYSFVNKKISCL